MNQPEMERQILHVLHRARSLQSLVELPLIQSICRQTGEPDAVAALERVICCALPKPDRRTAALRSVILDVDFERAGTNGQVAARRGVSRRHFQRLRAQAVSAVARYACDVLDHGESPGAPPAARRESLWRYERECEAYADALERGYVPQMKAIAANMLRIAENHEMRLSAQSRLADANLRLGKIDAALEQRADLSPAARSFIDAECALLSGSLLGAQAYAQAAALPLHAEHRFAAILLAAQVRTARGIPWEAPPPEVQTLAPESWKRTSFEAEYARYLLTVSPSESASLARMTWRRAVAFGYDGVAARCAATLGELARLRQDLQAERRWRARAIECLLRTSDLITASTLFPTPAYRHGNSMDDALCTALYERLCLIVPQMQGETEGQRDAVRNLIAATIDAALAVEGSDERLDAAVASVARSDSAFVHYAQRLSQAVGEMLTLALVALNAAPWDVVLEPVTELVTAIGSHLHPARPRTFPIVLPHWSRSQMGLADHLRINELAGLRVRFVPVRSAARGSLAWQLGGPAPRSASEVTAAIDSR